MDNPLVLYGTILVSGLAAALGLGFVAFFNSKRPAGWEAADRPGFVMEYGQGSDPSDWTIGWNERSERWNGRLAMLGFAASIITEAIVGHSVLGFMFGIS